MTESVFERCAACISNGVITETRVVIDPQTGEPEKNEDTGRIKQEPVDKKQATVWQCQFRQRGNLMPNIEFPENDDAEAFQSILEDTDRTVLYQMHHPLLDSNGDFKPLDRDPEKFQHGDYMLALVSPPKRKKQTESPRDMLRSRINEDIPDLAELNSICTGEAMNKALEEGGVDSQIITDLYSRLTFPRPTGDRTPAEPTQVIFIRADSGFDHLYVNVQNSARARKNVQAANLPAASESADVFGKS